LSSFSGAQPYLLITVKDGRLPTKQSYDISTEHVESEIFTIDKENAFFRANGIEEMDREYVLGVYSE